MKNNIKKYRRGGLKKILELKDGVKAAVVAPKHLLKVEEVAEGEHKEPRDAEEVRE